FTGQKRVAHCGLALAPLTTAIAIDQPEQRKRGFEGCAGVVQCKRSFQQCRCLDKFKWIAARNPVGDLASPPAIAAIGSAPVAPSARAAVFSCRGIATGSRRAAGRVASVATPFASHSCRRFPAAPAPRASLGGTRL